MKREFRSRRRRAWLLGTVFLFVAAALAITPWTSQHPTRIRLLTSEPGDPPPQRCEVDGDSREARRLEAGEDLARRVRVPSSAVLRYAVAAASDGAVAPTWQLTIEPSDGGPSVEEQVSTTRHWTERSVDLATLGGREVVIRARATGSAVCWGAPAIVPLSQNPALVIVILLDTVRADHTHVLGYDRATTPTLDALAREAIVFTDTASDVSWTRASVATLMTGQPSMMHGVLNRDAPLNDAHPTMAEYFQARGFRTVALSTNPNVLPVWGFARGFDQFVDVDAARWAANSDATRVFTAARAAIDAADREPLLLYVHVNDAHAPYDPPIETARLLLGNYTDQVPGKNLGPSSTAADVAGAVDRYDAEIAYLDHHVGKFFAFLKASDRWRDSLIVVVGDHGEEFHDHGGIYHGHTLFREQLHVPLLMKLPGSAAGGTRMTEATSVVDILPTMLTLIGSPEPDLPGRVLLGRNARPTSGTSLPRFATTDMDQTTVYAVEDETATLIVQTRPSERHWLFDRRNDPSQRHDLAGTDPARGARLQTLLDTRLLAHRRGWHVRVCGATEQPGALTLHIATGGTPTAVERIDLEAEDRLEVAPDGSTSTLATDLQPQQRVEEQFGKLVSQPKPDRDELVFATAPALTLTFGDVVVPVVVGLSAKGVNTKTVTVSLAEASVPAVFAPECPGFPTVFVWHAGTSETRTDVDPALLDRLRALGYAH